MPTGLFLPTPSRSGMAGEKVTAACLYRLEDWEAGCRGGVMARVLFHGHRETRTLQDSSVGPHDLEKDVERLTGR